MYRQDYIMRLIEQFGRVLADLLETIRTRGASAEDVRTELAAIARESGFDIDVGRRLDSRMLLTWLAPMGNIEEARFWLIGELLFLEGVQSREEGVADGGRADFQRAEAVFSKLPAEWRPQPDLASAGERVDEIRRMYDQS